ncbi:MAG: FliH/SctL family protein [Pseudomonadota bacterium]|nr:FliH/SctL family protein [Pseudomonadota bacterium]
MSDSVIPKQMQTPYQRWEMDSFGDNRASVKAAQAPAIARVTIEEQAAIREAAHEKGYAIGLAEGRAQGLLEGRADGAADIEHLCQIAATLGTEAARADELIASEVLALALDLAKAMLKTALAVRPELVLPVVGEAIRYLPTLQQPAVLLLHPADAALVRQHMQDELDKAGWRLADDLHMQRGGCRIETGSNQIDASAETRWQRLTEALGQPSDWLEP